MNKKFISLCATILISYIQPIAASNEPWISQSLQQKIDSLQPKLQEKLYNDLKSYEPINTNSDTQPQDNSVWECFGQLCCAPCLTSYNYTKKQELKKDLQKYVNSRTSFYITQQQKEEELGKSFQLALKLRSKRVYIICKTMGNMITTNGLQRCLPKSSTDFLTIEMIEKKKNLHS